jgi:hypothetical protein
MLHIIGMILKILGILILVIVGILLLILLIVLLVPIRYEVSLERYHRFLANGKVSWLFSIFQFQFSYSSKEGLLTEVKIFGRGKKEERDSYSEPQEEEEPVEAQLKALEEEISKETEEEKQQKKEKKKEEPIPSRSAKEAVQQIEEPVKVKEPEPVEDVDIEEKKVERGSMLKEYYHFLTIPSVKTTIKKIFVRLKKMARKILPRKLRADIYFGFDDPAMTGQVLAITSMFYALYYKCVNLEPDFENEVLEGTIYMKGKIRSLYFVSFALKTGIDLWFNKEIKTFIKSKLRRE